MQFLVFYILFEVFDHNVSLVGSVNADEVFKVGNILPDRSLLSRLQDSNEFILSNKLFITINVFNHNCIFRFFFRRFLGPKQRLLLNDYFFNSLKRLDGLFILPSSVSEYFLNEIVGYLVGSFYSRILYLLAAE